MLGTSFNDSISTWDVSNAISMSSMFQGASSFNHNINNWNVSNVTDMSSMFEGASSFNQNKDWDYLMDMSVCLTVHLVLIKIVGMYQMSPICLRCSNGNI